MTTLRCTHTFGSPACGYVLPERAGNRVGLGFDRCAGTFGECVERGDDEAVRGVAPEGEKDRRPQRFGWPIQRQ
jgi:hypothetical protein